MSEHLPDDPNQTFAELATRRMVGATADAPAEKKPAKLKLRAALAALGVGGALAGWGVALDGQQPLTLQPLVIAFNVASVLGILGVIVAVWSWLKNTTQRVLLLVAGVVVWRIAFFPIMVNAGFVTAIVEQVTAPQGPPLAIFPVFLPMIAAMFAGAMVVALFVICMPRWWSIGLAVVPATMAGLISFNDFSDLHPLPDRSFFLAEPAPPVPHLPGENPYLEPLKAGEISVPRMTMLAAAGSTYDYVPHSPWAAYVKGTLEHLFNAKPMGSTQDRVIEHYEAYIAAHRVLRSANSAPSPTPIP